MRLKERERFCKFGRRDGFKPESEVRALLERLRATKDGMETKPDVIREVGVG